LSTSANVPIELTAVTRAAKARRLRSIMARFRDETFESRLKRGRTRDALLPRPDGRQWFHRRLQPR
jgi:hypothetical protein